MRETGWQGPPHRVCRRFRVDRNARASIGGAATGLTLAEIWRSLIWNRLLGPFVFRCPTRQGLIVEGNYVRVGDVSQLEPFPLAHKSEFASIGPVQVPRALWRAFAEKLAGRMGRDELARLIASGIWMCAWTLHIWQSCTTDRGKCGAALTTANGIPRSVNSRH
jgi:hypothetical protein